VKAGTPVAKEKKLNCNWRAIKMKQLKDILQDTRVIRTEGNTGIRVSGLHLDSER